MAGKICWHCSHWAAKWRSQLNATGVSLPVKLRSYWLDSRQHQLCTRDRQLVFNHRQSLAGQLRSETDPAMALHLASVLLVHVHTQCMAHAPGRCVPQIVAFLKQYLPPEQHSTLLRCQGNNNSVVSYDWLACGTWLRNAQTFMCQLITTGNRFSSFLELEA